MKQIFICKEHHHVLIPWTKIRCKNEKLNLLTFDHHTDTHEAFLHYLYYNKNDVSVNPKLGQLLIEF